MIKELIVVEGRNDAEVVKRALPDSDVMITHGWGLSKGQIEALKTANQRRGVIIFTDPDRAGEMIRRRLSGLLPGCGHAFIPKNKAVRNGKVGVEAAKVEDVFQALMQVRSEGSLKREFQLEDLIAHGLSGGPDAAGRRHRLGALLSIGYGNSKNFLNRLNALGVTRDEFYRAIEQMEGKT